MHVGYVPTLQNPNGARSDEEVVSEELRLADLGITLSAPAAPVANYVGFVRTGNLLVVSGQLCFDAEGKLVAVGKLGDNVTIEDGQKAEITLDHVPDRHYEAKVAYVYPYLNAEARTGRIDGDECNVS